MQEEAPKPALEKEHNIEVEAFDAIKDEDIAGWIKKPEGPETATFDAIKDEDIEKWTQKPAEKIDDEIKNYTNLSKQQEESLHKIGVAAVEEGLTRTPDAAKTPEVAATAPTEEVKEAERNERTAGGKTSAPEVQPPTKEERERHFDMYGQKTESADEAAPNHNIIGRFGARLERMGIKLINAPQNIVLEKIYNWYDKRAAIAEGRHEECKRELAEAEAKLGTLDKSIELARTAGEFDASLSDKMNKERKGLVNKIEKSKTNLNAAHVSLEHYNGKKTTWESRQHNLAEKIVGEIDKRLRPSREVFAELAGQNERVTKEIDRVKQLKESGETRFKELHAQLANNPATKSEIRIKLAKVEEKLKLINDDYEQFTKAQSRIGAKMNNANTYIGQWDVMRNEQLRVTNKDNRYAEPGAQTQAERKENRKPVHSHMPDIVESEVAAAPQENTEASAPFKTPETDNSNEPAESAGHGVDEGNEPTPPGGAAARPLTVEEPRLESTQELKTNAGAYVKIWNDLFGKEMEIKEQDIVAFRPIGYTWEDLSLKQFEDAFKKALEKKLPQERVVYTKNNEKVTYTPAAIEDRMKKIREAYTQQAQKKAA